MVMQFIPTSYGLYQYGSENDPYLPHGRDLSLDPPPSGNSSQASYIYIKFWAFENQPTTPYRHQEFPILSVGGVWIFSGITQYQI